MIWNPDVRGAIEAIDYRIAKYEHNIKKLKMLKQALLAEFAVKDGPEPEIDETTGVVKLGDTI